MNFGLTGTMNIFFNIPGYNFVVKSRLHTTGGGVDLFVSETYNFCLRDNLTDIVVESIFIKIVPDNIIIGCFYRMPGSDISLFTAYIDNVLSKVNAERNKCYLGGDFNINLLKHDTHSPTADFLNCVFSHSFLSTINKPTRVTDFSATLIDNIITNVNLNNAFSSIIYADMLDNFPVFLQKKLSFKHTVNL